MSTADSERQERLTTEQIAAAGIGLDEDRLGPEEQAPSADRTGPPMQDRSDDADITRADEAGPGGGFAGSPHQDDSLDQAQSAGNTGVENGGILEPEPRTSLLEGDELRSFSARWKEIQAEFVDEPRTAVEQAEALVAELMQRTAEMFARQRAELRQRWESSGNGISTEELRQNLRRYRSFFERLLAA
jgi:hypothetical protein